MPQTSEDLQAAFGYLTEAELAGLKQLARMLPDNPIVVNIGAGAGTSGLAFMESRPDLFMITIDLQVGDSPFGCLIAEDRALKEAGFKSSRWMHFQGDSKDYGREWHRVCYDMFDNVRNGIATHKVDLCFVDADHSYLGAKGDILAWLPNIKLGGIIAVHDYDKKRVYASGQLSGKVMHPLPWPGVDRAVRKFLCPYFEIALHVDTLISFWVTEEGVRRLNDAMG